MWRTYTSLGFLRILKSDCQCKPSPCDCSGCRLGKCCTAYHMLSSVSAIWCCKKSGTRRRNWSYCAYPLLRRNSQRDRQCSSSSIAPPPLALSHRPPFPPSPRTGPEPGGPSLKALLPSACHGPLPTCSRALIHAFVNGQDYLQEIKITVVQSLSRLVQIRQQKALTAGLGNAAGLRQGRRGCALCILRRLSVMHAHTSLNQIESTC